MPRPTIMWAVFNFHLIWGEVYRLRKDAINSAVQALGSRKKFDLYRKEGSFRIVRVSVSEATE